MKINTTLRIDSNAIEYYKNKYKTNHAGCVRAVEVFPFIREESLKLLEGKFNDEELIFLEKASPKYKISSKDLASRRHWEAEIGDYYESSYDTSVNFTKLIEKIRELSPFDRFVLREMMWT